MVSELWLPAAVAAAALASTYFFCMRPMRRKGQCGIAPAGFESRRLEQEVAELRAAVDATIAGRQARGRPMGDGPHVIVHPGSPK